MFQSLQKKNKGILLMFASALCLCVGQLLWKLIPSYGWIFIVVGFAIYGIGALFMIVAYRFGDLSVLQPMNSISYVFSLIIASIILHEHISVLKIVGVAIIMIGIILIGGCKEV